MPIYEFYCADCHMIFNFLARTIHVTKQPACPRCGRPDLQRQVSRFAISKGRSEDQQPDESIPDIDEQRLEETMSAMAGDMDGLDDEDPRQMARMMRKLFDSAGMRVNDAMDEAIRRMEAGEDPDKIEEEMGDVLDAADPFSIEAFQAVRGRVTRSSPPNVDPNLYDL